MKFLEVAIYAVIARTDFYFAETGRRNSFERFPYLKTLAERLTEDALEDWEHSEGMQASRYWELIKLTGDGEVVDSVVHTAFDLCLASAYVPEFGAYLNYYSGNTATVQLAFEMEGVFCPSYEEVADKLRKLQIICQIDWSKVPLSYAAIEVDRRVMAYLFMEESENDKLLEQFVFGNGEWFLQGDEIHSMFVHSELAAACAEWIAAKESPTVLQIAGDGGRRFFAKHIARLLGQNLLLVSAEKCKVFFTEAAEEHRGDLIRDVFWRRGMVCLYGLKAELLKEWQVTEEDFRKNVMEPLLDMDISILVCTEERFSFYDGEMIGKRVELKPLTREERQQVFEGFAVMYGLSIDCAWYSVRYRLSAGEIAAALALWRQKDCGTEQDFTRISTRLLSGRSRTVLGNITYPEERFTDIMVPDQVQSTLEQICCSAMCGYRIFEEWGLGKQYPYGRALTVMLSGPPGTGKTMTAQAIAGELGLPLYQVDLSSVMDKYIGETEKHLEEIFSFAEKANVVLFFDEADALFGKRGEVSEGRDRYANMGVAYILQRIEQFEGIVILSTNFYNNIDKAFLRRMKYVLKYGMPDRDIRHRIWTSNLPKEQFREELDVDYLASQFEFTGGMIKNVVLSASVSAVYEERCLSMEHLLQAIRAEYEKMEWPVSPGMWGEYEYLMM